MKIINKIRSTIWASTFLIGSLLFPGIAAAGEGALLGLNINGFPNLDYSQVPGVVGQECTYDAVTDTLTIKAEATFTFFGDPGPLGFITGGLLDLQATIDDAGVLSGGTFTVHGSVSDGMTTYNDPLLTGTVSDYGIVNLTPGTTDQADFRITPAPVNSATGSLNSLIGANDIAVLMTMEIIAQNPSGGSGYPGSMIDDWACDRSKGQVGPTPPDGADPFECYSVNKVTIWDKSGTTSDEVKIEKGGFRFPPGEVFDPATDEVTITIDGLAIEIAAGSFEQNGTNLDYTFKTATGDKPKITVRLNVEKRQWELKLTDGDVSLIDNSDGVDITLSIGNFESTENVVLSPQGNKLKYTANPAVSCNTNDDGMKLSCIASMTVQHSSGTLVTKSTAEGTLLHRDTVFDDPGSGDIGIFHTSCSECLMCGDTNGNFTIVEISSLPGDNLSEVCGVPDASCSTLP